MHAPDADPAPPSTRPPRPVVGITLDLNTADGRTRVRASLAYAEAVRHAGGTPICLPPTDADAATHLALCDAFVLTGGDDPRTEPFGEPTHPRANPIDPRRQSAELALLEALAREAPDRPVLGVCLGMQLMALHAGGRLNQFMPDAIATAPDHAGDRVHRIVPTHDSPLPDGQVASYHRQCVDDAGALRVIAHAHDGVVEAIDDPARAFYMGVQWHPERTSDHALGAALFERLVEAAARVRSGAPEEPGK